MEGRRNLLRGPISPDPEPTPVPTTLTMTATPTAPQTPPQMIRRASRRHAGRAAIVDSAFELPYEQLAERCERGPRPDRAGRSGGRPRWRLWAPNQAEWILAARGGTHMAGAVLVPINTRMKGSEAADVLERSRAGCWCIGRFLARTTRRC